MEVVRKRETTKILQHLLIQELQIQKKISKQKQMEQVH